MDHVLLRLHIAIALAIIALAQPALARNQCGPGQIEEWRYLPGYPEPEETGLTESIARAKVDEKMSNPVCPSGRTLEIDTSDQDDQYAISAKCRSSTGILSNADPASASAFFTKCVAHDCTQYSGQTEDYLETTYALGTPFPTTQCYNNCEITVSQDTNTVATVSNGNITWPYGTGTYTGNNCSGGLPALQGTPQPDGCTPIDGLTICPENGQCPQGTTGGSVNGNEICVYDDPTTNDCVQVNGQEVCTNDPLCPGGKGTVNGEEACFDDQGNCTGAGCVDDGVESGCAVNNVTGEKVCVGDDPCNPPQAVVDNTQDDTPEACYSDTINGGDGDGDGDGDGGGSCDPSTDANCGQCDPATDEGCGECDPTLGQECEVNGGGDCDTPPTCKGAPITCKVAFYTWKQNCLFADPDLDQVEQKIDEALGNFGKNEDGSDKTKDITEYLNITGEARACNVQDYSFTAMGKTLTIRLSEWCIFLQVAGIIVLMWSGFQSFQIWRGI